MAYLLSDDFPNPQPFAIGQCVGQWLEIRNDLKKNIHALSAIYFIQVLTSDLC